MPNKKYGNNRRKAEKAHEVCRPGRGKLSAKRKVSKGFNFVSEKLVFGRAASRFGEPRSSFWEGFNFVRAKPPLRRAESRFGKPRTSRKGTILFFSLVRKERGVPQRFANLWTPGTIQISARFEIFADMTGVHHVTGHAGNRKVSGYRR